MNKTNTNLLCAFSAGFSGGVALDCFLSGQYATGTLLIVFTILNGILALN